MPGFLRRLLSAFEATLVLALAVFAASPELHAKLHGKAIDHDEGCVIALFANGVSSPAPTVVVAPAQPPKRLEAIRPIDALYLSSPRYLRQPERGPPARD